MNLKIRKINLFSFLNDRRGLAEIPLMIGLLIMAIAVPAATKMVQESQDKRSSAASATAYSCNAQACSSNYGCMRNGFYQSSTPDCANPIGSVPRTVDQSCPKRNGAGGGNDSACTSTGPTPTKYVDPNDCRVKPSLCGTTKICNQNTGFCEARPAVTDCSVYPSAAGCACTYNGITYRHGQKICGTSSTKEVLVCSTGKVSASTNCSSSQTCKNGTCETATCVSPTSSDGKVATGVVGSIQCGVASKNTKYLCNSSGDWTFDSNCPTGTVCKNMTSTMASCVATCSSTNCGGCTTQATCPTGCSWGYNGLSTMNCSKSKVAPTISASATVTGTTVTITASGSNIHHAAVAENSNFVGNMSASGAEFKYTVSNATSGSHTYTVKACSEAAINNECPIGASSTKTVTVNVGTVSIIQDAACKNKGGVCQNTTSSCSGTYTTGDCPSSGSTIKCCAPKAIVTPIPTTTVYKKPSFYVGVTLVGSDVVVTATGSNIHHAAVLEGSTFIGNMTGSWTYTVKAPSIGNHTYSVKACSVAAVNNVCPEGASHTVNAATINVVSTVTEVSCPSKCSTNFGCMMASVYTGLGDCTKPKPGTVTYSKVAETVCPKVGAVGIAAGGNNDSCSPIVDNGTYSIEKFEIEEKANGYMIYTPKYTLGTGVSNPPYIKIYVNDIEQTVSVGYGAAEHKMLMSVAFKDVVFKKGDVIKMKIFNFQNIEKDVKSYTWLATGSSNCSICKANPSAGLSNFMCKSSLDILNLGTWVTEMANFTETKKSDWKSDMNCDGVVNALDLPFIKNKFTL